MKKLLKDITKSVLLEHEKKGEEFVDEVTYSSYAVPVMQLLLASKRLKRKTKRKLQLILLKIPADSVDMKQVSDPSQECLKHVESMMSDNVGSNMLEAIVRSSDEDLYYFLYLHFFRGKVRKLSAKVPPTFVLQSLISSAKTDVHFNLIFDELTQEKDFSEFFCKLQFPFPFFGILTF